MYTKEHPGVPVEVRQILGSYNHFLEEEGFTNETSSNITRFGELILSHTNEYEVHKNSQGINVFILKDKYVKFTSSSSFDSSVQFLNDMRKTISPVRVIIAKYVSKFDPDFQQEQALPPELISLVGMIIEDNAYPSNALQSTLTIAGQIVYNFKKTSRKLKTSRQQTTSNQLTIRETPITSYASLKLYSVSRSKNLVDWFHFVGMTSSYNRVSRIISQMASKALKMYRNRYKVIPLKLRKGVPTIFTNVNFDKNSSSNDAKINFHGTSCCAFQPLNAMNDGISRYDLINDNDIEITDFSLPKSYTDVKHVVGKCNGYSCPVPTVNIPDAMCDDSLLEFRRVEEKKWMDAVLQSELNKPKCWSSYHARQKRSQVPSPCNNAIFPLLKDVVHTMDMQHHLISLAIVYTEHLNPKQVTAVDCSDEPIYALSKINQWLFPKFAFPKISPTLWCTPYRKSPSDRKWYFN